MLRQRRRWRGNIKMTLAHHLDGTRHVVTEHRFNQKQDTGIIMIGGTLVWEINGHNPILLTVNATSLSIA